MTPTLEPEIALQRLRAARQAMALAGTDEAQAMRDIERRFAE